MANTQGGVSTHLGEEIRQISEGIRRGEFVNEAAVQQGVVLRLLGVLGWPVFDPRSVAPEYAVEGRRVDLALCHPAGKPVVFVEVKRVGESEGADRQLFEYAFLVGVPMAVLTDGQEWHFYLPAEQGDYAERRVYKLDLLERESEECAERLSRYLNFEAVCSGQALQRARSDYRDVSKERQIRRVLPDAWAKLVEEEDELLIELVADKVESLCGYKPEAGAVVAYLASMTSSAPVGVAGAVTRSRVSAQATARRVAAEPSREGLGFQLGGQRFQCKNGAEVLERALGELQRRDPRFLERFASRPKHGRRRRYVARDKYELYPDRADLADAYSRQLPGGWWMGTNYGYREIRKILEMACEVAGLRFGEDLVVWLG